MKFLPKFILVKLIFLSGIAFCQNRIVVPDDYASLQEAVNSITLYNDSSHVRDTIYVRTGSYTGFEVFRNKYFVLTKFSSEQKVKIVPYNNEEPLIKIRFAEYINSDYPTNLESDSNAVIEINGLELIGSGNSQGGLLAYQCDIAITNCDFSNHSGWDISALSIFNSERNVIHNCSFRLNQSNSKSSSIWIEDSNAEISNCEFTKNMVSNNLLYTDQHSSVELIGCNINNNKGRGFVLNNSTIDSCSFIRNEQPALSLNTGTIKNTLVAQTFEYPKDFTLSALMIRGAVECDNLIMYDNKPTAIRSYNAKLVINDSKFLFNNLPFTHVNQDTSGKTSYSIMKITGNKSIQVSKSIFFSNFIAGKKIYNSPDRFVGIISNQFTGQMSMDSCDIINNDYFIYNYEENNNWLNLENNYWGDSSGPYNEKENPSGLGDSISFFINFAPYLDALVNFDYYFPPYNLRIVSYDPSEIQLTWDKSINKEDEHYVVYYALNDSASILNPYDSLISTNNFCTVNNIIPDSTYKFWARGVDASGNKSFYSNSVTCSPNPTSVKDASAKKQTFSLSQNYPNPFNPSTVIRYDVPKTTHVQIDIYNSVGQRVRTLVNKQHSPGYYSYSFDASFLSSGVYFYQIIANDFVDTKKMVLIK